MLAGTAIPRDGVCPFPLARGWGPRYRPLMKSRVACLVACAVIVSACEEKKSEVTVTETRQATTRDKDPKLSATSDERFRDSRPSPIQADTPDGWLKLPPAQFRLLNYRFGDSGKGEVYVSIASGTILDNANRWLGQFGATKLTEEGLEKLPAVTLAGAAGHWIRAEGEYSSGMGAEPRPGFALAGAIAALDGQILTVKMVGPKAEVEAARPVLEAFAQSLRRAE